MMQFGVFFKRFIPTILDFLMGSLTLQYKSTILKSPYWGGAEGSLLQGSVMRLPREYNENELKQTSLSKIKCKK